MSIGVNIAEAKARLSELIAAAERGEEVVIKRAGVPKVRLTPFEDVAKAERERIAAKRAAAVGKWKQAFEGYDVSVAALKADRGDPEERFGRKFGPAA